MYQLHLNPIIWKLDNYKVPRHPSFLLKINTLSFSLSLPLSHSLSLTLSHSLSLTLSLSHRWRGRAHPCKHKARPHSKHSSFSQSVSMRDYYINTTPRGTDCQLILNTICCFRLLLLVIRMTLATSCTNGLAEFTWGQCYKTFYVRKLRLLIKS